MKKVGQQRVDYALHRMGLTIERLLETEAKEEKAQAVRWMAAWKAMHEKALVCGCQLPNPFEQFNASP